MKFSTVLPKVFDEFEAAGIDFAIIGGLALYFSGAARTTFDADFMILLSNADEADRRLQHMGYRCIHRSTDAANYVSKDPDKGRIDFLFAHRRYATAMLVRAQPDRLFGRKVKVLQPEDLIGLKVQSSTNDPSRAAQDRADIEALIRRHYGKLDWVLLEDYYRLFDRLSELKELRKRLR